MGNPVKAFEQALRAHRVANSGAEKRLRDALRNATWHEEYIRVRQEDLRAVLKQPTPRDELREMWQH